MHFSSRLAVIGIASAVMLGVAVAPAAAKCTRLGFSVNDYGKDGPTKDAKALLDKYIADWAKSRGIAKYTTGKKTVNCELFIDVGLFDEHTCRAEASVCWGEGADSDAKPEKTAEKADDKPKKAAKKKAKKEE